MYKPYVHTGLTPNDLKLTVNTVTGRPNLSGVSGMPNTSSNATLTEDSSNLRLDSESSVYLPQLGTCLLIFIDICKCPLLSTMQFRRPQYRY